MKALLKFTLMAALGLIVAISCSKKEDEPTPAAKPGTVTLYYEGVAGANSLVYGTNYTNASNESFQVSMFNFYVSNIKLTKEDGTIYEVPTTNNSGYYLIKKSREIELADVPAGTYTSIEFTVGVDSLRSTMAPADRGGDLDVGDTAKGGSMYWSWNSGYIFMRFEGTSPAVPDSTKGKFVQDAAGAWTFDTIQYTVWNDVFNIHVGGFGGYSAATKNNLRKVSLSFGDSKLKVSEDKKPEVHMTADVLKIMDGTKSHSFSDFYHEHSPTRTGSIADNYKNMFKVHIHH